MNLKNYRNFYSVNCNIVFINSKLFFASDIDWQYLKISTLILRKNMHTKIFLFGEKFNNLLNLFIYLFII